MFNDNENSYQDNNYQKTENINFNNNNINTTNYEQNMAKQTNSKSSVAKIMFSSTVAIILTLIVTYFFMYQNIGLSNTLIYMMSGNFAMALITAIVLSFVLGFFNQKITVNNATWGWYVSGTIVINAILLYYLLLFKMLLSLFVTQEFANLILTSVVSVTLIMNIIIGIYQYVRAGKEFKSTNRAWWSLFLSGIGFVVFLGISSLLGVSFINSGIFNIIYIIFILLFIGYETYLLVKEYNNASYFEHNNESYAWKATSFRINILLVNLIVDLLNLILRLLSLGKKN